MSLPPEETDAPASLVLDYALDAPPARVWRAVSLAGFRAAWLPDADLADPDPAHLVPAEAGQGGEIGYRMRAATPPFEESLVTITVAPGAAGGTHLRIVQAPLPAIFLPAPANLDGPLMLAAA